MPTQTRIVPGLLLLTICGCASRQPIDNAGSGYATIATDLRRDTEKARLLNNQAVQLIQEGKLAEAEVVLKRALEADVTFGPGHNSLGKVYYHQGDLYRAAWEFQYAVKLMPYQPEPKNNLGMVFESTGKLDDAIASFDAAQQIAPDNPQYIGNSARARVSRGDRDEQLGRLLQRLIEVDTRTEWTTWARETLATMRAAPASQPVDHAEPR